MDDRSDPTPLEAALRKRPVQERSLQRVGQILDAASAVVAERGYEALTTSLVARRARVPPGTLYEFFADKRAVVQAVAARNLERFGARVTQALDGRQPHDVRTAARLMLDIYIDMCRADPGFRAVRFGDVVDSHLFDDHHDNDALVAARYAGLLSARMGIADTPELRRSLVVAVKVVDVLVEHAFIRDEAGDAWVLDRTRWLVDQHLSDLA